MMGSSLQEIPVEVLVDVLLLIGLPDIMSCRLVSADILYINVLTK